MPITKKDRVHREQKKAEAAGTRVPVHKNGTPVKAAKPKSICAYCRKELVRLFPSFERGFALRVVCKYLTALLGQHEPENSRAACKHA